MFLLEPLRDKSSVINFLLIFWHPINIAVLFDFNTLDTYIKTKDFSKLKLILFDTLNFMKINTLAPVYFLSLLFFTLEVRSEAILNFQNTTYTAPAEWVVQKTESFHQITSPEKDINVYLVTLPSQNNATDVVLKAWKKVQKNFSLKIDQQASPPPTDGWKAIHKFSFQVPLKDSRLVAAEMNVYQHKAYVTLIDAHMASLDKRRAQVSLIAGSWKPAALQDEKLGDREAITFSKKEAQALESFLQRSMSDLQIPGVQVALIQNGKIVWEKSLGYKQKAKSEKVKDTTLFMIGSTTKPLTTLLQGRVVDEGMLKWSTPLKEIFPSFTLADAAISSQFELRHTACACTGMPRRDLDFIFEYENILPEERIKQLKTMSPTTKFGETFQYSNLLVATGGYAVAHKLYPKLTLNSAYEKAMQQWVFGPLNMSQTRITPRATDDLASPHAIDFDGRITPLPQKMDNTVYAIAPAGAVWSTAQDLSQYVILELNQGKIGDKTLLTNESIDLRRKPQIKIDESAQYGLGLIYDSVKGLQTWGHSGGTLGFSSDLVFIPEKKLGWVLLSNAGASPLRSIFQQKVIEVMFKAKPESQKRLSYILQRRRETLAETRKKITTTSFKMKWLDGMVGEWQSKELGKMIISKTKRGFSADFGEWQSQLGVMTEKSAGETFVLISAPWGGTIPFQKQSDGSVLLDAGQTKYTFRRVE